MIDKEIAFVNDASYYRGKLVEKVMDVAIATYPDWVINNASGRAESIMNEGKAKYYDRAVIERETEVWGVKFFVFLFPPPPPKVAGLFHSDKR